MSTKHESDSDISTDIIDVSNAERFLAAFNSIEKFMGQTLDIDKYFPFHSLVDRLKKKNSLIAKYERDLKQYSKLRNAIVHEKTETSFVIAESHLKVVEAVESIRGKLMDPEKVIPKFKRRVISFETSDSLETVLEIIKKYGYTQFPIFECQLKIMDIYF